MERILKVRKKYTLGSSDLSKLWTRDGKVTAGKDYKSRDKTKTRARLRPLSGYILWEVVNGLLRVTS